jgi:hypothetical protein
MRNRSDRRTDPDVAETKHGATGNGHSALPSRGRRAVLFGAAAASAGAAASLAGRAAPASAAPASPASSARPVLLGKANTETSTTTISNHKRTALTATTTANGHSAMTGTDTSSKGGTGVSGTSRHGIGVAGTTRGTDQYGVEGIDASTDGGFAVFGTSTSGFGVYGQSTNGTAVAGKSANSTAVSGVTYGDGQYGVHGIDASTSGGYGIYGRSDNGYGVYGTSTGANAFGVYGESTQNDGVHGYTTGDHFSGVAGLDESASGGYGVYAYSLLGTALRVDGNATVSGSLSKGGGSFKIDHPLDPARKYLYHSFVESPDMMNIYNGTVTLDEFGRAVVGLPDWFEALNRDYRYQLTAIGAPAPGLHVAAEVSGGQFAIAGGAAGHKVSWQVTGIRQDAWANANRIPVEETKPAEDQGRYLHPELHGGEPITRIARARRVAALAEPQA